MKIIDTFIFYNELDMLDLRLNELNDTIDYFVLIEAGKTHSNIDKPYFFEDNKKRYHKFLHKIIHIKVEDMPERNFTTNNGNWAREHFQRNCIKRGLEKLELEDSDIILMCDVDEIPRIDVINNNKNIINGIFKLEMEFYYYNIQNKVQEIWPLARIFNYGSIKEDYINYLTKIRLLKNFNQDKIIKNGGWHMSYFGDKDFIKNKIEKFAYQEYNKKHITNEKTIEHLVKHNRDILQRKNFKLKKINQYIAWSDTDQKVLPKNYSRIVFPKLKELTHIGMKWNTDKSWSHFFTEFYNDYFQSFKYKELNILEIGIYQGASLKMLEEYFPKATIHSIDINKDYMNKKYGERIKTYYCSQEDSKTFNGLFKDTKFDIIIDDGSHQTNHQLISLGFMFKYLKENGLYVLEDLHTSYNKGYCNTRISALKVLEDFTQNSKISSEVISKENLDYLEKNIEKIDIFHKTSNNLKCFKCGKINFEDIEICECKAILSYKMNPSITSIIVKK